MRNSLDCFACNYSNDQRIWQLNLERVCKRVAKCFELLTGLVALCVTSLRLQKCLSCADYESSGDEDTELESCGSQVRIYRTCTLLLPDASAVHRVHASAMSCSIQTRLCCRLPGHEQQSLPSFCSVSSQFESGGSFAVVH